VRRCQPIQQRSDELTRSSLFIFINAFLIGTASGLRSLIGLAAVSWAVHLGILPVGHTWLAFLGYAFTPYILTLMAIGELVNDKQWQNGTMVALRRLRNSAGTEGSNGAALEINDFGMVAGTAENGEADSTCPGASVSPRTIEFKPVIWMKPFP
jgi:uncharacterized membrane protein